MVKLNVKKLLLVTLLFSSCINGQSLNNLNFCREYEDYIIYNLQVLNTIDSEIENEYVFLQELQIKEYYLYEAYPDLDNLTEEEKDNFDTEYDLLVSEIRKSNIRMEKSINQYAENKQQFINDLESINFFYKESSPYTTPHYSVTENYVIQIVDMTILSHESLEKLIIIYDDNNFKSAYSALTINTLNKEESTIFEKSTEDYLRRADRAFKYNETFFQVYVTSHDEIFESSECFTDLSNKAILNDK
jgi:hypothetical protein